MKTILAQDHGGKLLFSQTEAGKLLGFSRWTIAQMLNKFELGFVPRGRGNRKVPLAEINRWIEKNTVHNSEEWRKALDGRRGS